jgi:hypothetical protein
MLLQVKDDQLLTSKNASGERRLSRKLFAHSGTRKRETGSDPGERSARDCFARSLARFATLDL